MIASSPTWRQMAARNTSRARPREQCRATTTETSIWRVRSKSSASGEISHGAETIKKCGLKTPFVLPLFCPDQTFLNFRAAKSAKTTFANYLKLVDLRFLRSSCCVRVGRVLHDFFLSLHNVFRREAGNCRICWTTVALIDFNVSGKIMPWLFRNRIKLISTK